MNPRPGEAPRMGGNAAVSRLSASSRPHRGSEDVARRVGAPFPRNAGRTFRPKKRRLHTNAHENTASPPENGRSEGRAEERRLFERRGGVRLGDPPPTSKSLRRTMNERSIS